MPDLITTEELLDHIDREELTQVAGIGSHNAPEGRSLDADKIGAAIKFASDMVRGYMLRRFPLIADLDPIAVPDLVKGYVADIVRYRLRSRTGNRNSTSDEVDQRFKDARAWLQEVSRGLINVDFGDAPIAPGSTTDPMRKIHTVTTPPRSPGILDGFN